MLYLKKVLLFVRLEECELGECEGEGSTVHYLAKLPTFYTAPFTTLTIPCRIWGWPGKTQPKWSRAG
jgi:hypothetical protein